MDRWMDGQDRERMGGIDVDIWMDRWMYGQVD